MNPPISRHLGILTALSLFLWVAAPRAAAQTLDYSYETNNGTITITGYTCPRGAVIIPETINGLPVTSIGDWAFNGCSLTSVTIPDSVTSIGGAAFSECRSLTSVTIGNGVWSIGEYAFDGCTKLISVMVEEGNSVYSSLDGVLFNKSQTTLIQCPGGKAGSYMIPNSVTSIEASAFSGCNRLTNVTIPNSVTSIEASAFSGCNRLTNVTIPNSVTSIPDVAFFDCLNLKGAYFEGDAPSSVGASIFHGLVFFGFEMGGWISVPLPVTVYYLPGTTGWGDTFGELPTALWMRPNPVILSGSLSTQTNGFGFTTSWATNNSVVVETSTTLANPTWSPVATNILTSGTNYFSDLQWETTPARFYRVRSQ